MDPNPTRYRKDIDGLRAVAVVAVVLFHSGILPFGYLGVDVFFVISGYLITQLIASDLQHDRFSFSGFYLRRIRRILPLASVVTLAALAVGVTVMLPDDLENLSQSVVASNLFANNILQAITTRNYWDVANEYKPLMHTWSLGIEEQYYLVYPMLLSLLSARDKRLMLPGLCTLAAASFVLSWMPFKEYFKFYHLPFRFFELAAGGIAALSLPQRLAGSGWSWLALAGLVLLFGGGAGIVGTGWAITSAVVLSVALIAAPSTGRSAGLLLELPVVRGVGLISFSLYMWHQVVLAFARYFLFEELGAMELGVCLAVSVGLSLVSYSCVERPFRDRTRVSARAVLTTVGVAYLVSTAAALVIVDRSGVVRDVPELELAAGQVGRGAHAAFNRRVFELDRDFSGTNRIRVLVIGNSFARDWVNVLLASSIADRLDVSYIADPASHDAFAQRARAAQLIYFSEPVRRDVERLGVDISRVYAVGTKNFGRSNGIFYNDSGPGYFAQRARPDQTYIARNAAAKVEWGERYLDYFEKVLDSAGTVAVFTPDGKFISQDCRHLTRAGAAYFAQLFEAELRYAVASAERTAP